MHNSALREISRRAARGKSPALQAESRSGVAAKESRFLLMGDRVTGRRPAGFRPRSYSLTGTITSRHLRARVRPNERNPAFRERETDRDLLHPLRRTPPPLLQSEGPKQDRAGGCTAKKFWAKGRWFENAHDSAMLGLARTLRFILSSKSRSVLATDL